MVQSARAGSRARTVVHQDHLQVKPVVAKPQTKIGSPMFADVDEQCLLHVGNIGPGRCKTEEMLAKVFGRFGIVPSPFGVKYTYRKNPDDMAGIYIIGFRMFSERLPNMH